LNDGLSHFVNTLHHLRGRNAHHRHPAFFEPSIAVQVVLWSIAHVVTFSIDLNGEIRFGTKEVQYVGSYWMLTAKYRLARNPLAQSNPQAHFGR